MKKSAVLNIELIHIAGPLKGEIQELRDPEICIGRHPSCQVRFPANLTIVSRKHARIVREGNRFKIVDQSTNGTLVNGKSVKEGYLRNGDVITFAQGGPKISFLVKKAQGPTLHKPFDLTEQETLHKPAQDAGPWTPAFHLKDHAPENQPSGLPYPATDAKAAPGPGIPPIPPQGLGQMEDSKPVVVQFGPVIKSFKRLPITIGTEQSCDFIMDIPAFPDVKFRVSFRDGRYLVKNLSARSTIAVNGGIIEDEMPLAPNDVISFGNGQIQLEFIGEGRFAEVLRDRPGIQEPHEHRQGIPESPGQKGQKKAGSLFKKIFGS